MSLKCSPLLLPPSSIPPYHPPLHSNQSAPPPPLSPGPPAVPSVDSRRLLVCSARRRETAGIRERWKQHQQQQTTKVMTSRNVYPQSAPPESMMSPTQYMLLDLRKRLAAHGYGTSDESDIPCKERPLQFPLLEQELTKRDLTQRLPYHVNVDVEEEEEERTNYPSHHPSYSQVFFFSPQGARKSSSPSPTRVPRARCLRSEREERFFISPEWSSEAVGWQRFAHHSHPHRFRYSWM